MRQKYRCSNFWNAVEAVSAIVPEVREDLDPVTAIFQNHHLVSYEPSFTVWSTDSVNTASLYLT